MEGTEYVRESGMGRKSIQSEIDKSGVAVRCVALPSGLSVEAGRKAVMIVEDWDASGESAFALVEDLYPLLRDPS
jgi:hypothetical protein